MPPLVPMLLTLPVPLPVPLPCCRCSGCSAWLPPLYDLLQLPRIRFRLCLPLLPLLCLLCCSRGLPAGFQRQQLHAALACLGLYCPKVLPRIAVLRLQLQGGLQVICSVTQV